MSLTLASMDLPARPATVDSSDRTYRNMVRTSPKNALICASMLISALLFGLPVSAADCEIPEGAYLCTLCDADDRCMSAGRDFGICTVLPPETEAQEVMPGVTVTAGDKVCILQDTDRTDVPCVIRANDVSCQHCAAGDVCYLDGQSAGTCVENGGRRDCSQSISPAAAISSSAIRTPTLSVSIPGLSLSNIRTTQDGQFRVIEIPWLSDYVVGAYRYAIYLGVVLAAVILMIGGLQWLTAAGDAGRISAAKNRIINAVIGLILILGTYIMLISINPDLTQLHPLRIKVVERSAYSPERILQTSEEDTSGVMSAGR